MKKDLKNIYQSEDGQMTDITTLDQQTTNRPLRFALGLTIFTVIVAGVAWLGAWTFRHYAPDSVQNFFGGRNQQIELSIQGPDEVSAGDMVEYVIKYKNRGQVAVDETSLNVRYPAGLIVESVEPAARVRVDSQLKLEDNWDLGTLSRDQEGQIVIKGRLVGEDKSNQNFWAVLYYQPANFSSKFQQEASKTTTINGVPLQVEVSTAATIPPSEDLEIKIKYRNSTDKVLAKAAMEIVYPKDFTVQETQPENTDDRWLVENLEPQTENEITIIGHFAATTSGPQEFIVKSLLLDSQEDYLLQEQKIVVTVMESDVTIELKINGSREDDTVSFGDSLSYSLIYENTGDQTLSDVTASVIVSSTGELIDWTSLFDRYDGSLEEFEAGKILSWTSKEVPNLAKVKPGQKGVIDFSVDIVGAAGEASGDLNIRSAAAMKIGQVGDQSVTVEQKSNTVKLSLNSNISLTTKGRYFDDKGNPVGSGPLPPKVGGTTTYLIDWQIDNSLHEIQNVVLQTVLPTSVTYDKLVKVSVGDLTYNPATRVVSWTINRLPPSVATTGQASFAVKITPSGQDFGKVLLLTGEQRLTARDKNTNAIIEKVQGAITTDLLYDTSAKGRGTVVE